MCQTSQRRLFDIINGRAVAIILAGKSLSEFERRMEEFAGASICYFGLNSFHVQEDQLLWKIGRQFDLLLITWPEEFRRQVDRITSYLERDSQNAFITIKSNIAALRVESPDRHGRLAQHKSKILFLEDLNPPEAFRIRHHVNSATIMLTSLIFSGCTSPIFVLGMDAKPNDASYYRQEQLESYRPITRDFTSDVYCFTQNWRILLEVMRQRGLRRLPPILNYNMESGVDLFPKISYEFFLYLTGSPSIPVATALARIDPIGPAGSDGAYPSEETLEVSLRKMQEALMVMDPW